MFHWLERCAGSFWQQSLARSPRSLVWAANKADDTQHNNIVSGPTNLAYNRWREIRGLSFSGSASFVWDQELIESIGQQIQQKIPEAKEFSPSGSTMPWEGLLSLRMEPQVISLLDYSVDLGHTELYRVY